MRHGDTTERVVVARERAATFSSRGPRARGAAHRLMTQNRRLSQKNSVILYQLVMGDTSDSTSGIVQSRKRSASAAAVPLCKTQDCLAYNKKLGNGWCTDCCFERNVPFKIPKKKTVEKIDATATPAATTTLGPAVVHANGTKVLICAESNCAIAIVVNTFRAKTSTIAEKHKDLFKYKVQDAGDGVQYMVGSICANEYVDVTTTAWPAGAHPRNTLVLGMSRSITPSGIFESRDQWRNLEPFGTITGVSFKLGEPVHYVVQECAEIRVILASDVVLIEDKNVSSDAASEEKSPEPVPVAIPTTPQKNGLAATPPQKKNSPLKELLADTANVMKTFDHRASTASLGALTSSSQGALAAVSSSASNAILNAESEEAKADDIYLQYGIDVEARWISADVGYGMFAMRRIIGPVDVTTYDGPRVDCRTGEVLFECPWTHEIEKKYTAEKKFNRSKKWGDYEREHCVLLEHSNDVCIDGTFSSQPFLFKEGFHGRTGFAASFNSGCSQFVNMKKCYKRSSRFPYDPNGVRDRVRSCRAF